MESIYIQRIFYLIHIPEHGGRSAEHLAVSFAIGRVNQFILISQDQGIYLFLSIWTTLVYLKILLYWKLLLNCFSLLTLSLIPFVLFCIVLI